MGKKRNNESKAKKAGAELQPVSRTVTLNLHKRLYKVQFKKKAPTAVKEIKSYAKQVMRTNDVRIDPELNKDLWKNGIRNLDARVTVTLERKKNEDDDEGKDKMYTVVKLAN